MTLLAGAIKDVYSPHTAINAHKISLHTRTYLIISLETPPQKFYRMTQ